MSSGSFHDDDDTFHHITHAASGTVLAAGDIIRIFDGPFGDSIILGFRNDGEAKVSRPYAYASSVGTTGPTVLLGAETLTLTVSNLKTYLEKNPVVSRGQTTRR